MAVNMTFYSNFSKRENSTKQPSGGNVSYNVNFKDGFSISGGTILLSTAYNTAITFTEALYNNYYYFVTDVRIISNSMLEVDLKLDVLATYKSEIANYTSIITRSPYNKYIDILRDAAVAPTRELKIGHLDQLISTAGNYCYQLVCDNTAQYQAYFLDQTALNTFWGVLSASSIMSTFTNYFQNLVVLPIDISSITGNTITDLYIADTHLQVNSGILKGINSISASTIKDVNIPISSLPSYYRDERKFNNEYTDLEVIVGGSKTRLDANTLRYEDFNLVVSLDNITCNLQISIYGLTHDTIASGLDHTLLFRDCVNIGCGYIFSVGKAPQLLLLDAVNAIGNVVGATSKIFTSMDTGNAKGIVDGYMKVCDTAKEFKEEWIKSYTVRSSGGTYFAANSAIKIRFEITQYVSTEKVPAEVGYPFYENTSISAIEAIRSASTHDGNFYRFAIGDLSIASIIEVKNKIENFLTSGFFYE